MHKLGVMIVAGLAAFSCLVAPALAEDIDGVQEHPMVERYGNISKIICPIVCRLGH